MSTPPPSVGATCIALDRLLTRIRGLGYTGIGLEVFVEDIRSENVALRRRLAWFEEEHERLSKKRFR